LSSSASLQHWVLESKLEAAGWEKMLKFVDDAIAMRTTQYARPPNAVNVEKHLKDIGLEREFGTHMRIGALSGGQKVKVVLAAALWNWPHMLILDEPTNYLDRDSLVTASRVLQPSLVPLIYINSHIWRRCRYSRDLIRATRCGTRYVRSAADCNSFT
jgi:ABC-type sugar transport system ATPase subunit